MVGQGNERVDFFVNGRTFIDALKSCHLSENFCRTLSGDCEVYSWGRKRGLQINIGWVGRESKGESSVCSEKTFR